MRWVDENLDGAGHAGLASDESVRFDEVISKKWKQGARIRWMFGIEPPGIERYR